MSVKFKESTQSRCSHARKDHSMPLIFISSGSEYLPELKRSVSSYRTEQGKQIRNRN